MELKRSPWDIKDIWQDQVFDIDGIEQVSMINRRTGERYLSHSKLDYCNPQWLDFIKNHEAGHYVLQTDYKDDLTNEKLADTYGFYETMKKHKSLINVTDAHSWMLEQGQGDDGNPDHDARVQWMMYLAARYDRIVNKNKNANFDPSIL